MPDETSTIEQIREYFAGDLFATEACGCRVVEAAPGHAVCEFDVDRVHRNALGGVMGGAIFTVADFALAIASNVGSGSAVSVSNSIEFIGGCRGTRLTATADADKVGRTLGFYTVDVADDLGNRVARMTATCLRVKG